MHNYCGHGLVVEQVLAKDQTGVRFSLPALRIVYQNNTSVAPMVKWISQRSSEPLLWVRVLLGAQNKLNQRFN